MKYIPPTNISKAHKHKIKLAMNKRKRHCASGVARAYVDVVGFITASHRMCKWLEVASSLQMKGFAAGEL
jgi:hypothetical protein